MSTVHYPVLTMDALSEGQGGDLNAWTAGINHHHQQASLRAEEAVNHAAEAGKLLLKVKQKLTRGEFGPWLERNCPVSERTAQRYMSAALGKPMPVRAIAAPTIPDTLSVKELPSPTFIPLAGNWYHCSGRDGTDYFVEPSAEHPGHFYVSHLLRGGDYDCTNRPVPVGWVEDQLQRFGLRDAAGAMWQVKPSAGVNEAMGTFIEAGGHK